MSIEKGDLFASRDSRDTDLGGRVVRVVKHLTGDYWIVECIQHWNEKNQGRQYATSRQTLRTKFERVSH